ncbi:MAG: TspO/MBR family protein, partial [Patescibacteria group bacterium]
VLNTLWSIIFFGLHSPGGALIEIVFLWLAILATIIAFYKISRPAAWLLVPYIFWVSFASYLNYSIWRFNNNSTNDGQTGNASSETWPISESNDASRVSLNNFVPVGWNILQKTEGDLNGDVFRDAAVVLEFATTSKPYEEPPRKLLVLLGQEQGGYALDVESDTAILRSDEGGVFGDPFEAVQIVDGSLAVHFYGGSAWRWKQTFEFQYQKGGLSLKKAYLLDYYTGNNEGTSYDYDFASNTMEQDTGFMVGSESTPEPTTQRFVFTPDIYVRLDQFDPRDFHSIVDSLTLKSEDGEGDRFGIDPSDLLKELEQSATWPTFTSTDTPEYAFTFQYPTSWKVDNNFQAPASAVFSFRIGGTMLPGEAGDSYPLQLRIFVIPKDIYHDEEIYDPYGDKEPVEPSIDNVVIAGESRERRKYMTGYVEGGQTHQYIIPVQHGGYIFVLDFQYGLGMQACASSDDACQSKLRQLKEANVKIMDAIIKTFVFRYKYYE